MRNKIYLILFVFFHSYCFAQNNTIDDKLLDFSKYKAYKGKGTGGFYYFGTTTPFPSLPTADDYGPRKLGSKVFDWHSGVDFNNDEDGNGDEGYLDKERTFIILGEFQQDKFKPKFRFASLLFKKEHREPYLIT